MIICLGHIDLLGPASEFLGVFGHLIENRYKLEHFKSTTVYWQIVTLKHGENN
jgi:hypothetical protein